VKCKFLKITIIVITINTYAKTHLLKQFSTKYRWVASSSSGSCAEHCSAHQFKWLTVWLFAIVLNVFTFSSVCAHLVCCYCASSTLILKTIILQGNVATRFRCGVYRVCHKLYWKLFAGSNSKRIP